MTGRKKVHAYTEWAKSRLDEMDATIFVLEGKVEDLEADVRAKAETALDDMRSWRDSFKARIDENLQNSEKIWDDIKTHLDDDWNQFEDAVQTRMSASKDDAEQYKAAFKARAEAQIKGWQATIAELKSEAVKFKADRSADVDNAIVKMKDKAKEIEVKLDRLKKAESETASALNTALSESRSAFEKAYEEARKTFKDALD